MTKELAVNDTNDDDAWIARAVREKVHPAKPQAPQDEETPQHPVLAALDRWVDLWRVTFGPRKPSP